MNEIGVFYIATGVYKQFFSTFLETLPNLFANIKKRLIVISDGLQEYDGQTINDIDIKVEFFIDYPYPYINVNKFQIIYEYAKKNNISNIVYFDAETKILEYNDSINDIIISQINNDKLVLSYCPGIFDKLGIRKFMWAYDTLTQWGYNYGYDDFTLIFRPTYESLNIGWIRTSYFACNINVLEKIMLQLKSLINYNNGTLHLSLMLSDETYINYIYAYYENNFYVDYFFNSLDDYYDTAICIQKWEEPSKKRFIKHGTNHKFHCYILMQSNFNEQIKKINKFIIKNHPQFIINIYGSDFEYIYDDAYNKMYYNFKAYRRRYIFWDDWFNGKNNILLDKEFYKTIKYDALNTECSAFVNNINDHTMNFDYDKFFNEEYDCIKGASFNELRNDNFFDFDLVIFSQKYIDAYINNDLDFIPKQFEY